MSWNPFTTWTETYGTTSEEPEEQESYGATSDTNRRFKVIVRDKVTGNSLSGVKCELIGQNLWGGDHGWKATLYTDNSGTVVFEDLKQYFYWVKLSKDGYYNEETNRYNYTLDYGGNKQVESQQRLLKKSDGAQDDDDDDDDYEDYEEYESDESVDDIETGEDTFIPTDFGAGLLENLGPLTAVLTQDVVGIPAWVIVATGFTVLGLAIMFKPKKGQDN
jgi:hypothetical protein